MIKSLTRCGDPRIHFPNSSETSIEPFKIAKVFGSVNGSETVSSQILTGKDTHPGRIRQANFSHSWQNPCSPPGYDPDRCPKWIRTGSVISVSKEDLELFQKNPGEDPAYSGSNLESRHCKDFEQDRDLILLGSLQNLSGFLQEWLGMIVGILFSTATREWFCVILYET